MTITVPNDVKVAQDPFAKFSTDASLAPGARVYSQQSITLVANAIVNAGPYFISFGGAKNPRSLLATGVFSLSTKDSSGNAIADGPVGNIQMTLPGRFDSLTVSQSTGQNGAVATYTVAFIASVPMVDGDLFSF